MSSASIKDKDSQKSLRQSPPGPVLRNTTEDLRQKGSRGQYLPSILSKDLVLFSRLSSALWAQPEQARTAALDALSAASLQDLTFDRILDRAVVALLQRANRGGSGANARDNMKVLFQTFYRLTTEERVVLVALHLGRWSYARLSQILGVSSEKLQEIAWRARIQMASSSKVYPAAPAVLGPYCPDYDSTRPWTQRLLDDEVFAARERHFFQAHLVSCVSCKTSFLRCKGVYYEVQKEVDLAVADPQYLDLLQKIMRQSEIFKSPNQMTFLESLKIFFQRQEVRWPLFGILLGLLLAFLKH